MEADHTQPPAQGEASAAATADAADRFRADFASVRERVGAVVVGQREIVDGLLTCLFTGGHALLEGVPGIGKTLMVRSLAAALRLDFGRVQFTPDLMPADVTGTTVIDEGEDEHGRTRRRFVFQRGPIFAQMVLADEINRATPKTQSALLEAMQERGVTVAGTTHPLPEPFFVMATQNPIEQEGTYPLPEAQLDRFLLHVRVDYPDAAAETAILRLTRAEAGQGGTVAPPVVSQEQVFEARHALLDLHMAEAVEQYIVQLVIATRRPDRYSQALAGWIAYGASPRATIALDRCARAHAWLRGAEFVGPDDVQAVLGDVLRHRLLLTFEAEANGVTPDRVTEELLALVPAA